jgi:hypothetical protein
MRTKNTTPASIFVVLLTYVFLASNTSGELALCIGSNGHVALESLIHEHCHNHPHIEHDLHSMDHEHDRHEESPHCKPCIDIPIFIGPMDNRLPLEPVKPNQDALVCLLEPAVMPDYQFMLPVVPRRVFSVADENRFLRSIILIV